jgi:DNA-binding FadR family transcriptional regulator
MKDQSFALKSALLDDLRLARWQPGERLPTERQLSADYQVGRAAVRRVLAEIKQQGLITQAVGSGTYAAQPVTGPVLSPAMLMEARLALEPALVPLIVRNATTADLAALEACCRDADKAQSLAAFEQADGEFHRWLARATHNSFLNEMAEQMSQARSSAEWGSLKRRSATAERRLLYGRQHRALLGFLREREAASAREALVGHLTDVGRNMFE